MNTESPIRCITAKGDPFSIGFVLGEAAAEGIRKCVFVTEEFQALESRWKGTDYLRDLEKAARTAYPAFIQEIEGIASGAELEFAAVFLWNCRGDLRLPEDISLDARARAASGCTSLLIPTNKNKDAAVIAHNEDGAPEFLGHCFWVKIYPDDEPTFESFMYPGMLPGHTFGVNTAGIVQTINNIRVHDLKVGIPRHVICRAVLASSTLDDALDILNRNDRASGFHHNLGQAECQRVLSVEAPASGCEVREVTEPAAHANHLISDTFKALPQSITTSSKDRQAYANTMIANDVLTAEGGAEIILFDRDTPIYRTNDTSDDYAQTLATSIFKMHRDRIAWRIHATPDEQNFLTGVVNLHAAGSGN